MGRVTGSKRCGVEENSLGPQSRRHSSTFFAAITLAIVVTSTFAVAPVRASGKKPFINDTEIKLLYKTRSSMSDTSNCTYALAQPQDVCFVDGDERRLEPLASVVDFAPARLLLDANTLVREKLAYLKRGPLRVPCKEETAAPDGKEGDVRPVIQVAGQHPRGVERTLLINLVQAYHGSTALQNLLLSNGRIASVCAGGSHECEGKNLGRIRTSKGHMPPNGKDCGRGMYPLECHLKKWNFLDQEGRIVPKGFYQEQKAIDTILSDVGTAVNRAEKSGCGNSTDKKGLCGQHGADAEALENDATGEQQLSQFSHLKSNARNMTELTFTAMVWDLVATWSSLWDLEKPVLLEKTPTWFAGPAILHEALLRYAGPWPLHKVRPVYIVMWRPLCLASLSSNFRRAYKPKKRKPAPEKALHHLEALKREMSHIATTVKYMKWALNVGARIVAINYADLLWNATKVIKQIDLLLPCIAEAGYDPKWTPTSGVDVFSGNNIKTKGSTFGYGQSHPPESMCYDLQTNKCAANFLTACSSKQGGFGWLMENQLHEDHSYEDNPAVVDLMETYNTYVDYLLQHSQHNI